MSDGEPPQPKPKVKSKKAKSTSKPKSNQEPQNYRTTSQVPSSSDEDDTDAHESSNRPDNDDDDDDDDEGRTIPGKKRQKKGGSMDYNTFCKFLDGPGDSQQQSFETVNIFSDEEDDNDDDEMVIRADSDTGDETTGKSPPSTQSTHAQSSKRGDLISRTEKRGMKRGFGLGMTRKRSKH